MIGHIWVLAKKDLGSNTVDLQQGAVGVAVGLAALVASVAGAQKAAKIDGAGKCHEINQLFSIKQPKMTPLAYKRTGCPLFLTIFFDWHPSYNMVPQTSGFKWFQTWSYVIVSFLLQLKLPWNHISEEIRNQKVSEDIIKKIPEAEDWRTDKSIHSSWTGKKILGIKAQECTRLLWTDPPGQPAAFGVFASPFERLHPLRSKGHQRSKGPQVRSRLPCLQPVNVIYALSFPLGPKWHMACIWHTTNVYKCMLHVGRLPWTPLC